MQEVDTTKILRTAVAPGMFEDAEKGLEAGGIPPTSQPAGSDNVLPALPPSRAGGSGGEMPMAPSHSSSGRRRRHALT